MRPYADVVASSMGEGPLRFVFSRVREPPRYTRQTLVSRERVFMIQCPETMRNRGSHRHSQFDYRSLAAYFVPICTYQRRCLFGEIERGRMCLSQIGKTVVDEWERSEKIRDNVLLDAFVVMPNHLHGIVCIVPPDVEEVTPRGYDLDIGSNTLSIEKADWEDVRTHCSGSPADRSRRLRRENDRPRRHSGSLGSLVAGFKGAVTRRIYPDIARRKDSIWQSRYYDRILRNEREWRACRRYIDQNPARWSRDRYHRR